MNTFPLSIARLEPTIVFSTYCDFILQRRSIYLRRLGGQPPPWTSDQILRSFKFTNVWRATDRVSQKGIEISYSPESVASIKEGFFRILLFKFFNKIETWDLITERLGETPTWENFNFSQYDALLTILKAAGTKLYSNAYMMPCPNAYGKREIIFKHSMHLDMIQVMMNDRVPERMQEARSLKGAYQVLRGYHLIGDFMAYQFAIDFLYSPYLDYSENDFIMPGPGAKEGIEKCFKNPERRSAQNIIHLVKDYLDECFYVVLGVKSPPLFGRPLQLIDIQNCFCEISKYARVAHPEFNKERTHIKTGYDAKKARPLPRPLFPPKWGMDSEVDAFYAATAVV